MKVLAVSTSSDILGVCVTDDANLMGSFRVRGKKRHSVLLIPVIDELMKAVGIDISDVDLYACDTGPGSFTGIRIGVATVNAMALASGKPAVGVSSLDMLAVGAAYDGRYVSSMIYARNDQIYGALYKDSKLAGEYFAGSADDYLEIMEGITDETVLYTGDGSLAFREKIIRRFKGNAVFAASGQNMPNACTLACIALLSDPGQGFIKPFYMKKSSAKERIFEKNV